MEDQEAVKPPRSKPAFHDLAQRPLERDGAALPDLRGLRIEV